MAEVLVVTGGSRGIGAATALAAVRRGYHVCIVYRQRADAADQLIAQSREAPGRMIAVGADVGVEADVLRIFSTVDDQLGRLTGLVNNAGIIGAQGRVEDMEAARIENVLRTNTLGSFLCAREAVRRMSTRHGGDGGAIVNVSSRAAVLGSPNEYVDYAASKAGLDALTVGLAREVAAEGIRVNAVRPGLIHTDIHASGGDAGRVDRLAAGIPMGRGGLPEEVAAAILWLLSADASYVTGSILDIAGGR